MMSNQWISNDHKTLSSNIDINLQFEAKLLPLITAGFLWSAVSLRDGPVTFCAHCLPGQDGPFG